MLPNYKFIRINRFCQTPNKRQNVLHRKCKKSSVCWRSLSIAYLSSSQDTLLNKSTASLWEQTEPLSLSIFSYNQKWKSLYKNVTKKIITEAKDFKKSFEDTKGVIRIRILKKNTFRYIDDVLSLNAFCNPNLANWIQLIYLTESLI